MVASLEPVPAAIVAPLPQVTDLDSMVVTIGPRQGKRKPRAWPDHKRCLDGAPPNGEGTGPDRSVADFAWCLIAIDWGWSVEETADRLAELSEKAQERRDDYAIRTARSAAVAVKNRRIVLWR